MATKQEIEDAIEMRAEEIRKLRDALQSMEGEGDLEDALEIPPYVNVAVSCLRLIHRSLRLEHTSVTRRSGSEDYGSGVEDTENHTTKCRRLTTDETRLRQECCESIVSYLASSRINECIPGTLGDAEDLESLES